MMIPTRTPRSCARWRPIATRTRKRLTRSFLLAYHYLIEGHNDEAATELQAVVQLQPKDRLAAQLLKGIESHGNKEPPTDGPEPPPETFPETPPAASVDPDSVIGDWRASRDDGSSFQLRWAQTRSSIGNSLRTASSKSLAVPTRWRIIS